ncbi:nucleolar protein 12-domain-containing protein [Sparassis latifolia]|uniref:Ribosomal RNA-processing protein 17 n=1 Tax=Sparassis crispa TaxID=139825 RepID=A0A401GHA3_9APHY|nr:hypothetical protein SCP_0312710 [Sparassis crispa]GBE81542.1 hypothetical protein SCP_0312710 [Sparassis crispa]
MASSNLKILTKSHIIVAAKKRAKREQVKEVVFDDEARREFLTGFHKRKLQKKEDAKKKAQEREKKVRLEARREQRHMLAQRAALNAAETEKAYGGHIDDQDSETDWTGLANRSRNGARNETGQEEQYEYDEHVATVTVVEDFDPDDLIHGPDKAERTGDPTDDPSNSDGTILRTRHTRSSLGGNSRTKHTRPIERTKARIKNTVKSKDVKYQTSAARKAERMKQGRRKTEKAERAGGKASRRSETLRRKR